MNFSAIAAPEPIPGDEHGFALDAFRRVEGVCARGDITDSEELRGFLQAEAEECDRRAAYLRGMTKYYHENAAIAQVCEAKALRLMLERLDTSSVDAA